MILITDLGKKFTEKQLVGQSTKDPGENSKNIFESSPDLYFLVDDKEKLLDFKGNEDLLYLTPDMFLDKTISDVLPPNVAQKFDNAIKETYKTKKPTKIEYSLPINNNTYYFEATNLYISEDRVASHVKDITEQKKTDQNLTAILDHTHMLVAYLDSEFNFIRVNCAYAKADDKDESFFPGKNHFELYPNKENEEIFRKVVETGEPYYAYGKPFEYEEHPERGITYWDWSLVPIKNNTNKVEGLIFTLQNVTDQKIAEFNLKRSQEDYRSLIENFQGIAFQGYQDFTAAFFRGAVEEITGYIENDFLTGKVKWNEMIHEDDIPKLTGRIREFHDNNDKNRDKREYRIINKKGETKSILELCEKFYDPSVEKDGVRGIVVDITEKKLTEQKLKESEEKYRALFNNSPIGIGLSTLEGEALDSNKAMKDITGFSIEDLNKIGISSIYADPNARTEILELLQEYGKVRDYETKFKRKDKTEFIGSLTFEINELGGKKIIQTSLIDITERKKAEAKLKESERNYKNERDNLFNMLNSMEDGVYIINERYDIEFVNPSLKNEFGPVGNKKCYEYFQALSEPCPWCKTQKNIAQGSIRWEWDSPITKKFYEIIATPIKRADGIFSKLVIFHDITQRKKATNKLKIARERADMYLNLAGVILVALNKDGIITLLNKKGYKILEYEEGELIGIDWFENCIPPRLKEEVFGIFKQIINGDLEPAEFFINPIITKEGQERIIAWHNTMLYDKNGNITGTLSSGEDITERKKAEKELKRLSKLKSELLTRTSHELKTPAMHIKGYADLLLHKYKRNLGIEELQIISHIKKGVLRLETLIYDILHKAELDSGYSELNKSKNDLSSLIELSVKELSSFATLREHSIKLDIQENLITHFDKEQIHHVINNLITNAIKYTPLNGIIGITSTIMDDSITIAVQDNGIGLTKEQISRLFTQFGKIERYGQGFDIITEGTGLGLHIAKKIIDLHDGRIWVESGGINKGSTFYFSLPKIED